MKNFWSRLREGGPDSTLSWLIAIGCFILYFFCIGTNRSSGVLFKAMVEMYPNSSRQTLSWPFTLSGVAVIYAAPLTGLLSTKFSILAVTLVGIIIFAVGTFPCYFYTNVIFMSVFFGLIRGTGMSLATTAIPGVVANNFERLKATALGVTISGLSLGALVFPLFTQFFLDNYGFENTILLYGGLALSAAIGAIPLAIHKKSTPETSSNAQLSNDNLRGTANPVFEDDLQSNDKIEKHNESIPVQTISSKVPIEKYTQIEWTSDLEKKLNEKNKMENSVNDKSKEVPAVKVGAVASIKTILTSRGFYLVTVNTVSATMVAGIFSLIVVDYVVDKGLERHKGYFRDQLGSYDYVCYLLASFVFVSTVCFLVERFYRWHISRNQTTEPA